MNASSYFCKCNFRKALLLLKKRRYQDQLLERTENQISNIERMVSFVILHMLIFLFLKAYILWYNINIK